MSNLLKKLKMYVLILTDGGGDKTIKVIDEETWNWVTSSDPGQPANFNPERDGYAWYDPLVPASQIEKIKKECPIDPSDFAEMTEEERKENPYDYEHPQLSTGSWENDRLIYCMSADGFEDCYFETVREAGRAIRKNGHIFADELHGVMY